MMEEKEHSIASGTDGQEKEIKEFEWKSLQLSKFYKKIKTLGRGATGKIYSATDLTTRKVVVIKRVKSTEKRFAIPQVKKKAIITPTARVICIIILPIYQLFQLYKELQYLV